MVKDNLEVIGYYRLSPVYYSQYHNGSVLRMRGPVDEDKNKSYTGIVYFNWVTGKSTLPNGEPFIPKKIRYEIKGYIVGTIDITEAIEQINLSENEC